MPIGWCLCIVVHENSVLVLGGQTSLVVCKLLRVGQKSTRRDILGIWDVPVELRVLESQYFYFMVRHQASHDVPVVAARLLQGFIEKTKFTPHRWLEANSTISAVTIK